MKLSELFQSISSRFRHEPVEQEDSTIPKVKGCWERLSSIPKTACKGLRGIVSIISSAPGAVFRAFVSVFGTSKTSEIPITQTNLASKAINDLPKLTDVTWYSDVKINERGELIKLCEKTNQERILGPNDFIGYKNKGGKKESISVNSYLSMQPNGEMESDGEIELTRSAGHDALLIANVMEEKVQMERDALLRDPFVQDIQNAGIYTEKFGTLIQEIGPYAAEVFQEMLVMMCDVKEHEQKNVLRNIKELFFLASDQKYGKAVFERFCKSLLEDLEKTYKIEELKDQRSKLKEKCKLFEYPTRTSIEIEEKRKSLIAKKRDLQAKEAHALSLYNQEEARSLLSAGNPETIKEKFTDLRGAIIERYDPEIKEILAELRALPDKKTLEAEIDVLDGKIQEAEENVVKIMGGIISPQGRKTVEKACLKIQGLVQS